MPDGMLQNELLRRIDNLNPFLTPSEWGKQVRIQFKNNAKGFVTSRTSFDVVETPTGKKVERLPYVPDSTTGFTRGKISKDDAKSIKTFMDQFSHTDYQEDNEKKTDTLYILIAKTGDLVNNLDKKTKAAIQKNVKPDQSIVEFRYIEQTRDKNGTPRPSLKTMYLIVSNENALALKDLVNPRLNPNEFYQTFAEIFAAPHFSYFFEHTEYDETTNKIIRPLRPDLIRTQISETRGDGKTAIIKDVDYIGPIISEPTQTSEDTQQRTLEQTKPMKIGFARDVQQISSESGIEITDPNLMEYIDDLGHLIDNYDVAQIKREIHDLTDPKNRGLYNIEQLGVILKVLNNRIQKEAILTQGPRQHETIENNEQSFAKSLAEVIHGKRLSQDEDYDEFLRDEQWNNKPVNFESEKTKGYYVDMTYEERADFENRLDLNAACYAKRRIPSLEGINEKIPYAEIKTAETANLEMHTPGVTRAKSIYIWLFENDIVLGYRNDGSPITLRNAKGVNDNNESSIGELVLVRNYVRSQIRDAVIIGFKEKITNLTDPKDIKKYIDRYLNALDNPDNERELQIRIRDAEQIALNLLFLGNTFESLDSRWVVSNGHVSRIRSPQTVTDLVSMPMKIAMKPLDALINSFGKATGKKNFVGDLGYWAYTQTLKSNHRKELEFDERKPNHLETVNIVPIRNRRSWRQFWRVKDKGKTLNVPECYPVQMTRSVWEETKAKMPNGREVPLIDFMRRGEAIPWDRVIGDTMWRDYGSKLDKNGTVWDLLQGKSILRSTEGMENAGLWIEKVTKALSEFGMSENDEIKRWLLYTSSGKDISTRHINMRTGKTFLRKIIGKSSPGRTYLPNNKIFFPWDGEGLGRLS